MALKVDQPPLAPPLDYTLHFGTRWQREKAAAHNGSLEFPEDPNYIGQWVVGECVGKGASGRVRIARHRRTGQLAAVKIVPLHPVVTSRAPLTTQQAKSEKRRLAIDREIVMMKLMNHPNILRIYDVFEGEKELYLVLEYVEGGELFDLLLNYGRLRPLDALLFFKQIIYGINYAHTFSIFHRDLKLENILIHSLNPPLIKIADWGMAAFAPPALHLETSCGSPHYASPEVVNGLKYKGSASDIWSCGIILFVLLAGRLPFDAEDIRKLLSKVKVGKYAIPDYFDPGAKDLLTRMLVVDVKHRITIPEIMAHPWFNKPTPGIIYVPAPSVTQLARPLASVSSIDPDLLESLCVIWGKHRDVEMIKTDLLSPAGRGTLAKAFYFLLRKYREQALKDHGIIFDIDDTPVSPGVKFITKQYKTPPKKTIQADAMTGRAVPSSPSPSCTFTPRPLGSTLPATHEASRTAPTSLTGPRLQYGQPVSSHTYNVPTHRGGMGVGYVTGPNNATPKLPSRARTPTVSLPHPRENQVPHRRLGPNEQLSQPLTVPTAPLIEARFPGTPVHPGPDPCIIPAPVPTPAGVNEQVSTNSGDIKLRSAAGSDIDWVYIQPWHQTIPQCNGAQIFQTTTRGYAKTSAGRHNYTPPHRPRVEDSHRKRGTADKENRQYNPRQAESNVVQARDGIPGGRLDVERVGCDFCNTIYNAHENLKEMERRSQPPALDLHTPTHLRKRVSRPSMQNPSPFMPSVFASPVGEVKGWFSNLFNWKGHTYVLYSTDTMYHTRKEVIRILERFGVVVCPEEVDEHTVLRCRMSELIDTTSSSAGQKHVRFRVEFSSSSQEQWQTRSPQFGAAASLRSPGGHHVFAPISPTSRYGTSKISLDSGFACAVVLVQEKGSVSTFRTLCGWMKEEWTLDDSRSLSMGAGETPKSTM